MKQKYFSREKMEENKHKDNIWLGGIDPMFCALIEYDVSKPARSPAEQKIFNMRKKLIQTLDIHNISHDPLMWSGVNRMLVLIALDLQDSN